KHACGHPGAQFHDPITVANVMASKPVALPLKLLDCCPVSDGGAAFVVSREPTGATQLRVRGCAQAHTDQHVTAAPNLSELGAAQARLAQTRLQMPGRAEQGQVRAASGARWRGDGGVLSSHGSMFLERVR